MSLLLNLFLQLLELLGELVDTLHLVFIYFLGFLEFLVNPGSCIEEAKECDTQIEAWLIVVSALEESVTILSLDGDMLDRRIVDAGTHSLHVVVLVRYILVTTCVCVVILVTAEDIELLLVSEAFYLRENIITSYET